MANKWDVEGVVLPEGTKIRIAYKGRERYGEIRNREGCIDGHYYSSPTAILKSMATELKSRSINGRLYCDVKRPGDDCWVALRWLDHRKTF